MKRSSALGTLVLGGALTLPWLGRRRRNRPVDNLTVNKITDSLWVTRRDDGNTAVFAPSKGLTLNIKSSGWGQPLLDKIKTISDEPTTTVIRTHTLYDDVSGNVALRATVEIGSGVGPASGAERLTGFRHGR